MIFRDYLRSLRTRGYFYFTRQTALAELDISNNALNCAIYKLKKKGEIVSPAKNLYIMIPPEYQKTGCLPATELIPILMEHWKLSYYVCLLSAAEFHGASHQKPQVFQVMTNKQLNPLNCGKIQINFVYKKNIPTTHIERKTVKTGYLNISSVELTVMDLLTYLHASGGLNHVVTVLTELVESINIEKLEKVLRKSSQNAWIQRLGYLLEQIDSMNIEKQEQVINLLDQHLRKKKKESLPFVPLAAELPKTGMPKDIRWKIIKNTTIESDL